MLEKESLRVGNVVSQEDLLIQIKDVIMAVAMEEQPRSFGSCTLKIEY